MKQLFNKDTILKLIPQRPPFVLIDDFYAADSQVFKTSFIVPEGHMLTQDEFLSEGGIIENIAQTAASGVGYDCLINNKPVPIGFIGAVKRLKITRRPKTSEKLYTTVSVISKIMNATIVKGEVKVNNQLIADCELNIFLETDQ